MGAKQPDRDRDYRLRANANIELGRRRNLQIDTAGDIQELPDMREAFAQALILG
jgi:hypothetical protein